MSQEKTPREQPPSLQEAGPACIRRLETELREGEMRLRAALSAADMGTWLWQVPHDKQTLDENLHRLMGVPDGRTVQNLEEFLTFIHPDDRGAVAEAFHRSVGEGADLLVEFRVVRPDGAVRWLRDKGEVFKDHEGQVLYLTGACVDITERVEMEQALREADRRKDEFLALLAHELRNPLAPIRTGLQLLRMTDHAGMVSQTRDMIERQVEHLVRLVDDLLDVSRITRGKVKIHKEPVALAEITARALEVARPLIDARGQRLLVTQAGRSAQIEADPIRLAQVFSNLLNNAAKYTPEGGQITLAIERENGEAVVRVRDTGAGIPTEMLPKVFDLFTQVDRTLDRAQGGLGIGLTLVRTLVEMHGGKVEAFSEGLGKGSEFVVRLPALPANDSQPSAAKRHHAMAGLPRRILVVDNVAAAESLAALLKLTGHQVSTLHSGLKLVEEVRAFMPHAVLLDIGLPGLNGYEAAKRLRQEFGSALLLVALSRHGQEEDFRKAKEAGFDHHLLKPPNQEVLQQLLKEIAR